MGQTPDPLDTETPPRTNGHPEDDSSEGREMVFVPLGHLSGIPADIAEPSARELRRTYQIIQRLKAIEYQKTVRGKTTPEADAPDGDADPDAMHIPADATAEDAALALIRRRIHRMRPDTSWKDIAESVGMTIRTLWKRRAKAFPETHKYHPESGATDSHAKPD